MLDVQALKRQVSPLYTSGGACYDNEDGIAAGLSFVDNFGEPYHLYKELDDGRVLLPRMLAPDFGKDMRPKPEDCAINCTSQFVPRLDEAGKPEQQRICDEVLPQLKKGVSGIIQAATGTGKTYIGTHLACELGLRTLITVTKEDIKGQWLEAIEAVAGLKPHQVGLIQGNVCRYKGYPITICMIHSICKEDRYPAEVYSYFGLHMIDEVQYMAADGFSQAMWLWNSYVRLGLSATPKRSDGKDLLFRSHIGPVLSVSDGLPLTPKIILVDTGWQIPRAPMRKNGHVVLDMLGNVITEPVKHSPGKCGHIIKLMASNAVRNTKIAQLIAMSYSKDRNVVVFSDSLAHLDAIEKKIVEQGVVPLEDVGRYVGGLSESQREVAKHKRVVLATYKMCAVATNAPWWDTAILATPKANVTQIVGRVIRRHEGKVDALKALKGAPGKVPVVFDLVDSSSSVFKGYFKKRMWWYRSVSAPIIGK